MSLLDLAKLYNVSGGATLLVVSLWVVSRYPSAFFRSWIRAYLAAFGLLSCELVVPQMMGNPILRTLQIGLITTVIWNFFQTGRYLEGRPLRSKSYWVLLGAVVVPSLALLLLGKPFMLLFGPLVLVYSGTYIWLGRQLLILDRQHQDLPRRFWLGWPLIFSGLWCFTYPVLNDSPYAWVGYMVAGILNMLSGMGMALFLVDQTARDLRASKDELARDIDRSNTFIHTMSHELRTPLNSIKTAAFLVASSAESPLSAKQRELVQIIDGQSELLNRLVGDLLDYSRIESGLLTCEPGDEDLAELVQHVTGAMEKEFASKGVELRVEGVEDALDLQADGTRVMQVITNLLVNALKFTPAGGHVTVRVGRQGDRAYVEVADDGIGIAPEHQAAIFDKYFQVDGSSKRKVGGMGLGLAISRALVEAHGGTLGVRSELGRGATFRMELPLLPVAAGMMRA